VDPDKITAELEERGARVVSREDQVAGGSASAEDENEDGAGAPAGRRKTRLVVEWQA
jgi:hypothetical protein